LSEIFGHYESIDAGVTSVVDHAHHTWSSAHAEAGFEKLPLTAEPELGIVTRVLR
jgi:hypothetical protein